MSAIVLEAETRVDIGKGASRRLRRLENKVPGVIYGGDKKPIAIHIPQNKLNKALEDQSIFSSVFNISVDGKNHNVIIKDLQRHPYKPIILHMDFQRVSAKDVLVKNIPLHFTNEQDSKGVRAGGIITHTMNQVEVRCQVKDLPEFIEVDMTNVDMNDVVHLSNLKLPKGVELSIDVKDGSHDLPVVSIHAPKVVEEVEEVVAEEAEETAEGEEAPAEDTSAADDASEENKD